MSVVIRGMGMPDRCIDCPFMIGRDNDDCILQSDAANELFVDWDDMKKNCPLIELPEKHGRLVDIDQEITVMHPNGGVTTTTISALIFANIVDEMPQTVLEAES